MLERSFLLWQNRACAVPIILLHIDIIDNRQSCFASPTIWCIVNTTCNNGCYFVLNLLCCTPCQTRSQGTPQCCTVDVECESRAACIIVQLQEAAVASVFWMKESNARVPLVCFTSVHFQLQRWILKFKKKKNLLAVCFVTCSSLAKRSKCHPVTRKWGPNVEILTAVNM